MKLFDRFTLVMKSSFTSMRERVEDPERMLHQLVVDMEAEEKRVRTSVAGAIADEIQLKKKVAAARDETRLWMDRAAEALRRGDDDSGRAALEQKGLSEARAEKLNDEHRRQQEQTAKLRRAVTDLEDKIRQARQKRTLLIARLARADSERRIQRALDHAEDGSAFAQFQRLEEKVERSEALTEAWDCLEGRDPDAAELERRFAEEERKRKLETELAELKTRLGTSSS